MKDLIECWLDVGLDKKRCIDPETFVRLKCSDTHLSRAPPKPRGASFKDL